MGGSASQRGSVVAWYAVQSGNVVDWCVAGIWGVAIRRRDIGPPSVRRAAECWSVLGRAEWQMGSVVSWVDVEAGGGGDMKAVLHGMAWVMHQAVKGWREALDQLDQDDGGRRDAAVRGAVDQLRESLRALDMACTRAMIVTEPAASRDS